MKGIRGKSLIEFDSKDYYAKFPFHIDCSKTTTKGRYDSLTNPANIVASLV